MDKAKEYQYFMSFSASKPTAVFNIENALGIQATNDEVKELIKSGYIIDAGKNNQGDKLYRITRLGKERRDN